MPTEEINWDSIETRARGNAIENEFENIDPKYKSILWCPSLDAEMKGIFRNALLGLMDLYPTPLEGGKKQLGYFEPTMKLYLLAHGHEFVPVFKTDKSWTPEELADMLVSDGLSQEQRVIELLVCNAGQSVNTKAKGMKLLGLRKKVYEARAKGDTKTETSLQAKIQASKREDHQAKPFESDPQNLMLPLAAQLAQALKNRHFSDFSIISYKAKLSTYFGAAGDGRIHLDLPGRDPVPVEAIDNRRVIWRVM